MAIPASGPLQLAGTIQAEFGGSAPTALSEYYRGGSYVGAGASNVPTSGRIRMSDFYGATSVIPGNSGIITADASYTVPSTAGTKVGVIVIGAGGSGGGGTGRVQNTGPYTGGGGGSSGEIRGSYFTVVPGVTTVSVTIGVAGAQGNGRDGGYSAGSDGGTGGATRVTFSTGQSIQAAGGLGGRVAVHITNYQPSASVVSYNGYTCKNPGTEYAQGDRGPNTGGYDPGIILSGYSSTVTYNKGENAYAFFDAVQFYNAGANSIIANTPFLGGGSGALGWNLDPAVPSNTSSRFNIVIPPNIETAGWGNAGLYQTTDPEGGAWYSQLRVYPKNSLANNGYGAGGGGGGRDNEYWGLSGGGVPLQGQQGQQGAAIIWWGYGL